jgi:hypothetical protein
MNKYAQEHWEQICANIAIQMLEYIKPFVSPISRVLSGDNGEHLGSGSYFEIEGRKYIITNEHVAKYLASNSLTHLFYGSEHVFKLTNPAFAMAAPIDVAISRIEEKVWNMYSHEALAIPFNHFAQIHSPAQHELLFFTGYSGQRSKFLFDSLITPATPYLTQECPFPNKVNSADKNFHFALHYNPDLAKSVDGSSHLPDPHGFSGSLVWDTRRVECLQAGKEWSPKLAKVSGIVWGWSSSEACILGTKIEHIKLGKFENIIMNAENGN